MKTQGKSGENQFQILLPFSPEQSAEWTASIERLNETRRARGLTLRPEWIQPGKQKEQAGKQAHDPAVLAAEQLMRFQLPSATFTAEEFEDPEALQEKLGLVQDRIVELLECALAIIETAKSERVAHLHALVILHLASIYSQSHAYQNAVNLLKQVPGLTESPRLIARSNSGLGDIFLRLGLLDDAMRQYSSAKDLFKSIIARERAKRTGGSSQDDDGPTVVSVCDAVDLLWLGRCLYGLILANEGLNLHYGAHVCRTSLLSLFQNAPQLDLEWMWKLSGLIVRPGVSETENGQATLKGDIRTRLQQAVNAEDLAQVTSKLD